MLNEEKKDNYYFNNQIHHKTELFKEKILQISILNLQMNYLNSNENMNIFQNLKILDLSNNHITSLNDDFPESLTILILNLNKLVSLSNDKNGKISPFNKLINLEKLWIDNNNIDKLNDHILPFNTKIKVNIYIIIKKNQ